MGVCRVHCLSMFFFFYWNILVLFTYYYACTRNICVYKHSVYKICLILFLIFQIHWDITDIQNCIGVQSNGLHLLWSNYHNKFRKHPSAFIDSVKRENRKEKTYFLPVILLGFTLLTTFMYIIQCVNCSHQVIYYVFSIYLSYNWKFIPFDCLSPILPPPHFPPSNHKCDLLF